MIMYGLYLYFVICDVMTFKCVMQMCEF